jgi:hypothetical protein
MATAINVDTTACTLSIEPHPAAFTLTFAPWPATTFLKCPVTVLPARGTLSVNDVRTTTRMGRTVRYLVPVFTLSGEIS